MNDAIFELILNETIKDISRYKEVDEDFFVECFMNNVKLFASDDVLTEAGWKDLGTAVKESAKKIGNVRFTPGGQDKRLIWGKSGETSHLGDVARKGVRKVFNWANKSGNSPQSTAQAQPTTSQTTQPTRQTTPTQAVQAGITRRVNMSGSTGNRVMTPTTVKSNLRFQGQPKLRFAP